MAPAISGTRTIRPKAESVEYASPNGVPERRVGPSVDDSLAVPPPTTAEYCSTQLPKSAGSSTIACSLMSAGTTASNRRYPRATNCAI